jgi:hypothetical protein
MYFFFFSRVTRIKLATQVFLWEPKSDFAGVKKNGYGYGAAKMIIAIEMYMV